MTTIQDIFNESVNGSALVSSSLYFQYGSKLVRFADYASKSYNFQENNEGVTDILLGFVNANMTEAEMQENVSEISEELNVNVDYTYFNDSEDESTLFVVGTVKRFLN